MPSVTTSFSIVWSNLKLFHNTSHFLALARLGSSRSEANRKHCFLGRGSTSTPHMPSDPDMVWC
jgi:hypothetical protein